MKKNAPVMRMQKRFEKMINLKKISSICFFGQKSFLEIVPSYFLF